MWPFAPSATPEVEPTETAEDKLAAAEREAIFAEGAYDATVSALRSYNDAHRQMPFSYTAGDVTRIVTMANDAERRQLEKNVRSALERRNRAWSERANLLRALGKIR